MKTWSAVREWIAITFATAIIAMSVFFFLMPSHLSVSSISGLSIILANFLPLSVSAITMVLNLALLGLGFALIGRGFGVKTVYTSILLPLFLGILERLFPQGGSLTGDALIDMICYCFFVSIGLAMLFERNASSGGIDIVAKLMNRFLRLELGQAMSLAGMCVAVSAIFVYDIKTVLLSVIGTYLNGIILDHFIFGSTMKKRVCIVSKKQAEIKTFILHQLHSGATVYDARGAYTDEPFQEIIAIVDKAEYLKLMNYLAKADPDAFVTVYAVNEIIYKPKV
ncbi:MAG: YitT family protein [Eubacteriales bacterium]|nr:YitT family protein [Eubacteriales bacterium]